MRDGWDKLVFSAYREDYFDELSTHTWGLVNGYFYNSTHGGYLHRYMMAKWYSSDKANAGCSIFSITLSHHLNTKIDMIVHRLLTHIKRF